MLPNINVVTDELTKAKDHLTRLEKEREERTAKFATELKDAKEKGVRGQALQDLKERKESWWSVNNFAIESVKNKIAALHGQMNSLELQRQKQSRANVAELKAKALTAWKNNGGDEQDFDAAWHEIEKDLLKQKVLDALKWQADSIKKSSGLI